MTARAHGAFEVTMTPQPSSDPPEVTSVSRMSLDKHVHGDLEATSKGQMLAVRTDVAMEQVTGTLHGRSGAFALQHSGTMTQGTSQLSVTVVPDSGTKGLAGLAGSMTIDIVDGRHLYDFEYTLPEAQ